MPSFLLMIIVAIMRQNIVNGNVGMIVDVNVNMIMDTIMDTIMNTIMGSMGPMEAVERSAERSMEHPVVKRLQAMSKPADNTSGMDTNMGIRLSKGGITGNKNPMVSKILGTVIRGVKA